MRLLKWSVTVLGIALGGWLFQDGVRALLVGDYVTRPSGAYAGKLGPWADVLSAIGVAPRSLAAKAGITLLGVTWLLSIMVLYIEARFAWWPLVLCSIATLWYAPFGTVVGVIVLSLLLRPGVRAAMRSARSGVR